MEGPRLSLLRNLAALRDWEARNPDMVDEHWPTHTPLFGAAEWSYDADAMKLAAREAAAIGHIDATTLTGVPAAMFGCMIRITDAGYDYIKAHDAIGEAEQEVSR